MAQSGKPWHICDDCLDPLAHDLLSIAHRFHRSFDVAKADRLDAEYRQIQEDSAYSDDRLTDDQRTRRDELLEQMRAQTDPPRAFDVDSLYRQYRIDLAIDWLKFNVSVEYAEDFQRTLLDAKKRFSALEFKACQIINGDEGKESTTVVRYAIQRLIDRHYELLRETFPDHESHPDREELPDDLRAFEVEILDEYTEAGQQIREAGNYLRRVSALVRSKMKKADVGDIQRQIAEGFQAAQAGLAGRDITDAIIEAGNAAQGDDEAEANLTENDDPIPVARSASESVLLFDRHDRPVVNGTEKPTLTNAQYDVVLALLQTGDKGLTKDELDRESRRGDARKILKRLSDADSDWQSVISFPGTTGKGYRII